MEMLAQELEGGTGGAEGAHPSDKSPSQITGATPPELGQDSNQVEKPGAVTEKVTEGDGGEGGGGGEMEEEGRTVKTKAEKKAAKKEREKKKKEASKQKGKQGASDSAKQQQQQASDMQDSSSSKVDLHKAEVEDKKETIIQKEKQISHGSVEMPPSSQTGDSSEAVVTERETGAGSATLEAGGKEENVEGEGDGEEGDEKKKKKKKKKKAEEEKKPKSKKPAKSAILKMKEQVELMRAEQKRREEEELARQQAEEEARRKAEELERLQQEKKEKKRQKEKEKKERRKAEGKPLTKADRERQAKAQAMLQALKEQGAQVPGLAAGEKSDGSVGKGKVLYGSRQRGKKKLQTEAQEKVEDKDGHTAEDANIESVADVELVGEAEQQEEVRT